MSAKKAICRGRRPSGWLTAWKKPVAPIARERMSVVSRTAREGRAVGRDRRVCSSWVTGALACRTVVCAGGACRETGGLDYVFLRGCDLRLLAQRED